MVGCPPIPPSLHWIGVVLCHPRCLEEAERTLNFGAIPKKCRILHFLQISRLETTGEKTSSFANITAAELCSFQYCSKALLNEYFCSYVAFTVLRNFGKFQKKSIICMYIKKCVKERVFAPCLNLKHAITQKELGNKVLFAMGKKACKWGEKTELSFHTYSFLEFLRCASGGEEK